jgi:hypothetical protein
VSVADGVLGAVVNFLRPSSPSLARPLGVSITEWNKRADTLKPTGYNAAVSQAVALYLGKSDADTRAQLARLYPNAYGRIQPVSLPLLAKLVRELARVFGGDGERWTLEPAEKVDPDDAAAVQAHRDLEVRWRREVLDPAELVRKLREADRLDLAASRVFVRVTWDEDAGAVRLTLFPGDKVRVVRAPDSVSLNRADGVSLEIEPLVEPLASGNTRVERWEFWRAGEYPLNFIEDGNGRVSVPHVDPEAPYPYRDDPDGYLRANPPMDAPAIVPIVSFAGIDADLGYWQPPPEDLIGAARTLALMQSDVLHTSRLQSHGQPVATQTGEQADAWPGKVSFNPDEVLPIPRGWNFGIESFGANTAAADDAITSYLKRVAGLNGLTAASVAQDAQTVASGVALQIERAPLLERRADRVELFRRSVHELLRVIQIVWNAHQPDNSTRFAGVTPRWVEGELRSPTDPEQAERVRAARVKNGLTSPVRELAYERDIPHDEAVAEVEAIRAENGADERETLTAVGSRIAAGSLLSQAKSDAGEPAEAEAEPMELDDGTGPITGPDGESVSFFMYELEGGVVTINEMRRAKGLKPDPRFGNMTLPEYRAANRETFAASTTTQTGGSAEKLTGLADVVTE